jgi:F0F1-type ATP synthase membrane subunit a
VVNGTVVSLVVLGLVVVLFVANRMPVEIGSALVLWATGVTTWVGQQLAAHAGGSRRRLLVLIMLLVAAVTALINLNGSVAALMPMLLMVAVQRDIPPPSCSCRWRSRAARARCCC